MREFTIPAYLRYLQRRTDGSRCPCNGVAVSRMDDLMTVHDNMGKRVTGYQAPQTEARRQFGWTGADFIHIIS